jgi:hypothetical protein
MAAADFPSSTRDNHAVKDASRHDDHLEKAIEDSFPASDPVAVTQPARSPVAEAESSTSTSETEQCLDEGLEDSFPASDPPSMTQPAGESIGAPPREKRVEGEPRVADFLKPPA